MAPSILPVVGALACAFFVGPWTGRAGIRYQIAGWLLALGVVLWVLTWMANRGLRGKKTFLRDPGELGPITTSSTGVPRPGGRAHAASSRPGQPPSAALAGGAVGLRAMM